MATTMDEPLEKEGPTCARCGSPRIRRSHARGAHQRLAKAVTPLERYACGTCGHRGWRLGKLPRHQREEVAQPPVRTPSRPLERRDLRARRALRLRLLGAILLSVALGALAANRLVSCEGQRAQQGGP